MVTGFGDIFASLDINHMDFHPRMQNITIQFQITSPNDLHCHNLIRQLMLLKIAQMVLMCHDIRDVSVLGLLEDSRGERGEKTVVERVAVQEVEVRDETDGR